jgi:hypothetical protein
MKMAIKSHGKYNKQIKLLFPKKKRTIKLAFCFIFMYDHHLNEGMYTAFDLFFMSQ